MGCKQPILQYVKIGCLQFFHLFCGTMKLMSTYENRQCANKGIKIEGYWQYTFFSSTLNNTWTLKLLPIVKSLFDLYNQPRL